MDSITLRAFNLRNHKSKTYNLIRVDVYNDFGWTVLFDNKSLKQQDLVKFVIAKLNNATDFS